MNSVEIQTKLVSIAAKIINIYDKDIDINKPLEDMGADSMHAVEILMAVEDHFDIEIPDDDAINIHTLKEMIGYIQKRLTGD